MNFAEAFAFAQRWVIEAGNGWRVQGDEAGFRLLYMGSKVLYCTKRGAGFSAWLDIAERADEEILLPFCASLSRHRDGPSVGRRGIGLIKVRDLRGLMAWCRSEAPRRPRFPLQARSRIAIAGRPAQRIGLDADYRADSIARRPATEPLLGSPAATALEAKIRTIVEPDWPHDYLRTVEALAEACPFDQIAPVYFVGNLRQVQPGFVLIIGMNPNVRDETERGFLGGQFEQYWQSRINYFSGPSFNRLHYRPHAAFVSGFTGGEATPARDEWGWVLDGSAVAVDLCPLSSREAPDGRLLAGWLERKDHAVFERAADVLNEVVRSGRPGHILVRYEATAQRLLALLPRRGRQELVIGGTAIPFSVLTGQVVGSTDAFRLGRAAAALSRTRTGTA